MTRPVRGSKVRIMRGMGADYFHDHAQGAGAIAAAAPAPRSAPAPSMYRQVGYEGVGRIREDEPGTDTGPQGGGGGPGPVTGNFPRPRPRFGGTFPRPPVSKPPRTPIWPTDPKPAPPKTQTISPQIVIAMPPINVAHPQPPRPIVATDPKPAPPKSQTVFGQGSGAGGGWTGPAGGGPKVRLDTMAPPATMEQEEVQSAMTGGLPAGAAKLWLILGVGGVGYLAFRHFTKKRRRR